MFASRYKENRCQDSFLQEIEEHDTGEACRRVGITPQYLSRIENGGYTKCVSLSTLMKIAEKLGITMSELMEGVEDTSL